MTEPPAPAVPSVFDRVPKIATQPHHAAGRRRVAFLSTLLAAPAAVAVTVGLGSRRHCVARGVLAGGIAALALGALRWQLGRWFLEEPDHRVDAEVGKLELRTYPVRLDARAEVDVDDLELAMARGFGHLACYAHGANDRHEDLHAGTTPVLIAMRDGRYAVSFVMPPGRSLASLPRPDDPRVELREIPEKRIAVLRFRGPITRASIEAHERVLLHELVDAGLSAKGSVMFARYDSPTTLPILRRNELWIEIV